MEHMSDRLRWAREQAGFGSARSVALALGIKPSTYAAHDNGQNNFKEDSAKIYGKAFNVSWFWLLYNRGASTPSREELDEYAKLPSPGPLRPEAKNPKTIPSFNTIAPPQPNAIVGDRIVSFGKTIPIYGSAVGGVDGEFPMNGSVLFEVIAPPVLNDVSGAYAVLVSGDSMEPRYYDGETAFVDPSRRVVRGDFVVAQIQIEAEGPILAYIKRFVKHNADELVLEQFNPEKQLTFPHQNVVSVHYIVMSGRT